MKQQRILITGGSGLVGRRLTSLLLGEGHVVSWMSRSGKSIDNVQGYQWDVDSRTMDYSALEWADTVIHLAGEGVANGRWTKVQKQRILDSRIESTKLLHDAMREVDSKPSRFVSASAIGYYGLDNGERLLLEESPAGTDFLADVTSKWEQAVDQIAGLSIPVTKVRIGVVLSKEGGALEKMSLPIRWGAGAALGPGSQYMSWIHVDDLCAMLSHILKEDLSGAYNAVSPHPVSNKQMTKSIAVHLKRPFFLPNIPAFILKLALGEMADMLLGSCNVSSQKIEDTGFKYEFPTLGEALRKL
jgi:uncharacterized protein (TIGR01777 family)